MFFRQYTCRHNFSSSLFFQFFSRSLASFLTQDTTFPSRFSINTRMQEKENVELILMTYYPSTAVVKVLHMVGQDKQFPNWVPVIECRSRKHETWVKKGHGTSLRVKKKKHKEKMVLMFCPLRFFFGLLI